MPFSGKNITTMIDPLQVRDISDLIPGDRIDGASAGMNECNGVIGVSSEDPDPKVTDWQRDVEWNPYWNYFIGYATGSTFVAPVDPGENKPIGIQLVLPDQYQVPSDDDALVCWVQAEQDTAFGEILNPSASAAEQVTSVTDVLVYEGQWVWGARQATKPESNVVRFNGNTTFELITTSNAVPNSDKYTISISVAPSASQVSIASLLTGGAAARFRFELSPAEEIRWDGGVSNVDNSVQMESSNGVIPEGSLSQIVFSVDHSTSTFLMTLDGVVFNGYEFVTFFDTQVNFADVSRWRISGRYQEVISQWFIGDMTDLRFESDVFYDLTDPAVRAKFWNDTESAPAYLGENGELPSNKLPEIFMGSSMDASDWNSGENRGSLGDFTLIGDPVTDVPSAATLDLDQLVVFLVAEGWLASVVGDGIFIDFAAGVTVSRGQLVAHAIPLGTPGPLLNDIIDALADQGF